MGVDIDREVLEPARRRVAATGLDGIELLEADAQTHLFGAGGYDVLVSRFGTMFFTDPQAAFANLARALRPDGRVAWMCWREVCRNEWAAVPVGAMVAELGRAPDLGPPGAPARSPSPTVTGSPGCWKPVASPT